MASTSEFIKSPDFQNRTPLEKANSFKELFERTLNDNPDFAVQLGTLPVEEQQKTVDAWKERVVKENEDAFSVTEYIYTQEKGKNEQRVAKGERALFPEAVPVKSRVRSAEEEKILSAFDVRTPEGRERLKLFSEKFPLNGTSPEAKMMRVALRRRYGDFLTPIDTGGVFDDESVQEYDAPTFTDMIKQASPDILRAGGAIVGGIVGAGLGSPTGPGAVATASVGSMAGAAAVEPYAQQWEQWLGKRSDASFKEGAVNVLFAGIPMANLPKAVQASKALTVAARGVEGAALGAGYSGISQLTRDDGKPFDFDEFKAAATGGGILGVGIGAAPVVAKIPSKMRQALKGKTVEEAVELFPELKKLSQGELDELLAVEQRIAKGEEGVSSAKPKEVPEAIKDFDADSNAKIEQLYGLPPEAEVKRVGDVGGKMAEQFERGATSAKIDPVLQVALAKGATVASGAVGGFSYGFNQDSEADIQDRISKGLTLAVVGAGGGYLIGRSFKPTSLGAASSAEIKEAISHISEEGRAKPRKTFKQLFNMARTKIMSEKATLDDLLPDIRSANPAAVIPEPQIPLSRYAELSAASAAEAHVNHYNEHFYSKIPVAYRDSADVIMFMKRTGQRLQDMEAQAAEKAAIIQKYGSQAELEAALSKDPKNAQMVSDLATLSKENIDKSVGDYTLQKVDATLAAVRKEIGDEMYAKLDQLASGSFQQIAQELIDMRVAGGLTSQSKAAATKAANDFYAPFVNMDYEDAYIGGLEKITGLHATDFIIGKPTQKMAEKIVATHVSIERNKLLNRVASLADYDDSGTVIKRLAEGEKAPSGMEEVFYFEEGVRRKIAVRPAIAKTLLTSSDVDVGFVGSLVSRFNNTFKASTTGLNVAFQSINAPLDVVRSLTNSKYRWTSEGAVYKIPVDFGVGLFTSLLGPSRTLASAGAVTGAYAGLEAGEGFEDKATKAIAGAVGGYAAGRLARPGINELTRHKAVDLYREFQLSGAGGSTRQELIETIARGGKSVNIAKELKTSFSPIRSLSDFGKMVEETSKIMTFQRGKRMEGLSFKTGKDAEETLSAIASEVRNFGGSPDFRRMGQWTRSLNMAFVFFNPALQGAASDYSRLAGMDGYKQAAGMLAANAPVALAASYFWFLNNEPENKEDFKKLTSRERDGAVMIPKYDEKGNPVYFTNQYGEKARDYYKIPVRDMSRAVVNTTNAMLDFMEKKDPAVLAEAGAGILQKTSPVNIEGRNMQERAESFISSMGPAAGIPYMYATNRIPGLHRNIYSANPEMANTSDPTIRYDERTSSSAKWVASIAPQWFADPLRDPIKLQATYNMLAGGIGTQLMERKVSEDRRPEMAGLAQSPLFNRYVTSGAMDRRVSEEATQAVKEQSTEKVLLRRSAEEKLKAFKALPADEQNAQWEQMSEEEQDVIIKEYERQESAREKPELKAIRSLNVENGARAKYIYKTYKSLPADKAAAFVEELRNAKPSLLTDAVNDQLDELFSAEEVQQ